jgi:hypothetical protein
MKNIYYGILIAIILCVSSFLVGKFGFSTHEIEVKEKVVYKTIYKETTPTEFNQQNFDLLTSWVNSPIQFKDRTEKNYLFVTAFDDHKEATARYEIGTVGDWKLYGCLIGAGAIAGGYAIYKLTK